MEYKDPHQFQGPKVKGQGRQAAVGGCSSQHLQGRVILWRPHSALQAAQLVEYYM